MKKVLLMLAIAAGTLTSFAQRSVDLAIDEVTPDNGQVTKEKPITYKVVCKNMGTDSLVSGDSIFVLLPIGSNIFVFPKYLDAGYGPNDTFSVMASLGLSGNPAQGVDAQICFIASAQNRSEDSLKRDGNPQNNQKCVNVRFGWYDGIQDAAALNSLATYPNPANENFNLNYTLNANSTISLTLTDAAGREVFASRNQQRAAGVQNETINTSNLANGLYYYRLHIGNESSNGKMLVAH